MAGNVQLTQLLRSLEVEHGPKPKFNLSFFEAGAGARVGCYLLELLISTCRIFTTCPNRASVAVSHQKLAPIATASPRAVANSIIPPPFQFVNEVIHSIYYSLQPHSTKHSLRQPPSLFREAI